MKEKKFIQIRIFDWDNTRCIFWRILVFDVNILPFSNRANFFKEKKGDTTIHKIHHKGDRNMEWSSSKESYCVERYWNFKIMQIDNREYGKII